MKACLVFAFVCVGAGLVTVWPSTSIDALQSERGAAARESRIPVRNASLAAREIGHHSAVAEVGCDLRGNDG